MREPIQPFHYHARPFLQATLVVVLAGLCFSPSADGQDLSRQDSQHQDSPQNHTADRAAPNQSIEIDPSGGGVATADDVPEDQPAPTGQGESSGKVGKKGAQPMPVRTLRPRATGTSVLGRPDSGDTPWYRSGIGALSIVLAVIIGVMFVARRYVPSMRAPEGDVLKVVARANLSPKQTLSLIQLGRRFVLVAISAGRVDVLCEVDDTDEVAELIMATGAKFPGRASGFDVQLRAETANYDDSAVNGLEDAMGSTQRERGRAVSDLLARLKTLRRTN